MTTTVAPAAGSFRDPANRVYLFGNRVLRGINEASRQNFTALTQAAFFKDGVNRGAIVSTSIAPDDVSGPILSHGWAAVLEHERLPLLSYPYEWTFSMLKDAALLHLALLEECVRCGWLIKDSTPYNIQFVGTRPVFIDIPSFVPRVPGGHWAGYRQFCMMFLYPLMLKAHLGIDFQPFLRANLDGVSPAEAARLFRGASKLKRGVLTHVTMPAAVERRVENAEKDRAPAKRRTAMHSDPMVLGLVQSMRRLVSSLNSPLRHTAWSEYADTHSYEEESYRDKIDFVRSAARTGEWRMAWDIGSNTGTFSEICADHAQFVIAVDGDHDAVEKLYLSQKSANGGKILPLVMNLANPSPDHGWAGAERVGFDKRNRPDFVICLALIHHICLSANVPIPLFLDWLASLKAKLVIEFVDRDDEMVRKLLTNKSETYPLYNIDHFEAELQSRFAVLDSRPLKGGYRKIYFCKPRQ